ncbi:ketosynthase chain-length factor (plasmid) [Streptomyces sp. BI20]|uniref:ketosynthase chain-length factor n=1 Tax=Streptomyces sp. BI20 TaxID=3403460 RepID=UPI003C748CB3
MTTTAPTRHRAPVVTGIGVTAPTGGDTDTWWRATLRGDNAIAPLTRFDASTYPARLAGEIRDQDPTDRLPKRLLAQTDHMTRLALVAADEALADAGITPDTHPDHAVGTVTAASSGGYAFGQRELQALWSKGPQHVSAYQSFAWFYAVNTGQISIRHNLRGPSGVLVTEQAGGLDAVAQARRHIRKGTTAVVTGGIDSALCPWGWAAHLADGRLSTAEDPTRAYLPFTPHADGHVVGEGGALLVLEDADAAHARGARPYGAVVGHAATFDPPPGSGAAPRLLDAARAALRDADLTPADIDLVLADAAGDRAADRAEATALTALFGPRGVPVTAPKTGTGRLSSGGSALDLATALHALRDEVIPPTPHVTELAEDCPLDLVTTARPAPGLRTALVLARGRGGFNTAMIVRAR